MALFESYKQLIGAVKEMDGVLSIGKSGGEDLPTQDESDIDIFVFCTQVPSVRARLAAVDKLGTAVSQKMIHEKGGKFWGICDFVMIGSTELCLMYFTVSDMDSEIESVLNGSRPDRENDYFYPTGRCATFLSMHILCDKTRYIEDMKKRLSEYPRSLAEMLWNHHIKKINDAEDFERAVARGDALFYHATLDSAMDHFLQALFALNQCFFPSRKRSLQFIAEFKRRPDDCTGCLLKVIELGAKAQTLSQSYDIWSALCGELAQLAQPISA